MCLTLPLSLSQVRMGDRSSDEAKMARRVLVYVFDTCLRLLHPFMPFVTEVSNSNGSVLVHTIYMSTVEQCVFLPW
jgi:valyl-tRNA synthetase